MATLQFFRRFRPAVPLILRLAAGISFCAFHGYAKVHPDSGWDFGKAFVEHMSGKAPVFLLYLAAWTEFAGGIALALGFLTRWVALAFTFEMAYAIFKIHAGMGYVAWEKAFAWGVVVLAVLFLGPGKVSLDRMIFGRQSVSDD